MSSSVLRTLAFTSLSTPLYRAFSSIPVSRNFRNQYAVSSLITSLHQPRRRAFSDNPSRSQIASRRLPTPCLYVGNIPFIAEEADLQQTFSAFGPIKTIRLGTTPDGKSRGYAHLEFASLDDAIKTLEAAAEEPLFVMDRRLRIDYAKPITKWIENPPPHHNIVAYEYNGGEAELKSAFKDFADHILRVNITKIPGTTQPNGFAFIDFTSIERATQAMEALNGQYTRSGVQLRLRYAKPRYGSEGRRDNRGLDRPSRSQQRD